MRGGMPFCGLRIRADLIDGDNPSRSPDDRNSGEYLHSYGNSAAHSEEVSQVYGIGLPSCIAGNLKDYRPTFIRRI